MVRRALTPLVLLASLGFFYVVTLPDGHDWGGDFAVYLTHARNIASGLSYHQSSYLPTSWSTIHHPAAYPPLFPLLISPLYRHYGLNLRPYQFLCSFMLAGAAALLWFLCRQLGLSFASSTLLTLSAALSALWLATRQSVGPEPVYVSLTYAALVYFGKLYATSRDTAKPLTTGALTGTLMFSVYATRAAGLSLPVAFSLYEWYRNQRIRTFMVVSLTVFGIAFLLLILLLYDPRLYANQFQPDFSAYRSNILFYMRSLGAMWSHAPAGLRYTLIGSSTILASTYFILRFPKQLCLLDFYLATSVAVAVAYTSAPSPRYLLAVYPLVLLYAFLGARKIDLALNLRHNMLQSLFLAFLTAGSASNIALMPREPLREGVHQSSFHELCDFLRKNLTAQDVVISWNPRAIALFSERISTLYPEAFSASEFLAKLKETKASHVVYYAGNEADHLWLKPYLSRYGELFKIVFVNSDFLVYRFFPERGQGGNAGVQKTELSS